MNIKIKKENKASSVYTFDFTAKKARRTQQITWLKRKFKSIDIGELLFVSLTFATIIGMIVGLLTGASIVYLIFVLVMGVTLIVLFISDLGAK